jgi:hypothetical protein
MLLEQHLYNTMYVNIFKSVRAPWGQNAELGQIVCSMQSDQKIRLRTLLYRKLRTSGDIMGTEYMKTTKFSAFAPCALFYGSKRKEYVKGLTYLCYLDFDHIDDEERLINALNILHGDRSVLMASRSVSNEGLHILLRYRLKDTELPPKRDSMSPDEMQNLYGEVHDYFAAKYIQKLDLIPDYNARNMGHLYIVSYDPELYYNPNAESLLIDLE